MGSVHSHRVSGRPHRRDGHHHTHTARHCQIACRWKHCAKGLAPFVESALLPRVAAPLPVARSGVPRTRRRFDGRVEHVKMCDAGYFVQMVKAGTMQALACINLRPHGEGGASFKQWPIRTSLPGRMTLSHPPPFFRRPAITMSRSKPAPSPAI